MCKSIRVQGRIVEWTADGITWEADPRHAELIRKSFGRDRPIKLRHLASETNSLTLKERFPVDKAPSDRYRANTMRAQYLSSDIPEIQVLGSGTQDATAVEPR